MTKEPEEKQHRPEKESQSPKQRSDRSRHMAWGFDDVEHHGPKELERKPAAQPFKDRKF